MDDLTSFLTYNQIVNQFIEMGRIHEDCAKRLNESITENLRSQYESERKGIEKKRSELTKLNMSLDQTKKSLENVWTKYVMSFKEKQKAHEHMKRAMNDIQMARIDQQKVSNLN